MDYLFNAITMTSRDISKLTSKRHSDVMRDIRKEAEQIGEDAQRIFALGSYKDQNNQERPQYTFGRDGAMQLALKYDAATRYKVIQKLNELEAKHKLPTHAEALRLYADQLEENLRLTEENELMKPKAELHDTFLSVQDSITMNECAKAVGYGRNKLFGYLRNKKVLMKNNLPYQSYVDRGYFTVREVVINHADYTDTKSQTLVTTKGCSWIAKQLKEDGVI